MSYIELDIDGDLPDGGMCCDNPLTAVSVTQSIGGVVPYILYITTLFSCEGARGGCGTTHTVTKAVLADTARYIT